jgi:hypothetical protein
MNHSETAHLKLPQGLTDKQLREFHQIQAERIYLAKKIGWCVNMLPVANELKRLAQAEMNSRLMSWRISKSQL